MFFSCLGGVWRWNGASAEWRGKKQKPKTSQSLACEDRLFFSFSLFLFPEEHHASHHAPSQGSARSANNVPTPTIDTVCTLVLTQVFFSSAPRYSSRRNFKTKNLTHNTHRVQP